MVLGAGSEVEQRFAYVLVHALDLATVLDEAAGNGYHLGGEPTVLAWHVELEPMVH